MDDLYRPVIMAVVPVWMVQASVHQVAGMIAVGNGFVTAIRAVGVVRTVGAPVRQSLSLRRVPARNREAVLFALPVGGRVVEMAVVEIVHVPVVPDARMAASGSVLVWVGPRVGVWHGSSRRCNTTEVLTL